MPSSHRCVFGCVTTGVTIHKFPNPSKYPEQFRAWVELAGQCLRGIKDDIIYKNKKVCDVHFGDNVKNRNNRLNVLAVPTLHLPNASYITLELNRNFQSLPSTSGHFSDNLLMDINNDDCGQPAAPSTTNVSMSPQTTGSNILTAVNNDHTYCSKTDKSSSSKTPQTTVTRKVGFACYKGMQKTIRNLRSEICRLRNRSKNFKTRLASAIKLSESSALQKVTDKMSLPAKLFTNIQFRETNKKAKGRRFTNEEKFLAISLFKRSPKSYALLSKCFTLPSSKCLKNLLGKIKLAPGINKIIFEKLKHTAGQMNEDDRLCTLVFDEMSINPQLHYNSAQDEIKGLTTIGQNNIADHVLTFMVRGVNKNFKQPVAYYFTNCLNKFDLKKSIKEVIQYVHSTGLKIVATVCDQSTVNVSAIESLVRDSKEIYLKRGQNWKSDVIILGGKKIIPLYDVPHLLKGIRNNLLTKDLKYFDYEDEKEKTIKWEYFQKVYEADKVYGELKILHKLTEEHINPQKINKMKVKTATQVFSRSVAIAAKHLVDSGNLDPECLQITPFVLILDKLFDSLNCSTFQPLNGKTYRAGVRVNSPHHKLWQESLLFLKNIKFIEKKIVSHKIRITEKVVPSIKNFIKTLEGMQAIWKMLRGKYAFDVMLCRNFNQDPLENFFGNIRSVGVRNVAPNTVGFEGAFKALLLNNFCTSHSIKANCEDDMSTFLQSVDFFLKSTDCSEKNSENNMDHTNEIIISEELLQCSEKKESNDPESYVCGWVLRKCSKKIIKGCSQCNINLITSDLPSNAFIKAKEYCNDKKWLCYPSEELKQCFTEIQQVTVNVLKKEFNVKNVKKEIKMLNEIFVNFNIFNCEKHKNQLKEYFEDISINVILYSWCRNVNRILCGKMKYDGDDYCKTKAQLYYDKHKHNKNRK